MKRKYRIKQKGVWYYPQYRVLFIFWEYFNELKVHINHTPQYIRVQRKSFEESEVIIQNDKNKRFKKTTTIK